MNRKEFIVSGLAGMTTLNELQNFASAQKNTDAQPVLFLGHGSPMNAIEENNFVAEFRNVAGQIEKPKAVLCISAHWYTNGTKVMSNIAPPTIHDFGGFPKELFAVQYPAPGMPELVKDTIDLLQGSAQPDDQWGLDHGAWSVLKHFFPKADIPVVQLSIDYTKPFSYHLELGRKLAKLRQKGILIVGSGNIVHNLRMVDWANFEKKDHGFDWAKKARAEINHYIDKRDFDTLASEKLLSTEARMGMPTPDHYLPLLYTLGAAKSSENIVKFNDEMIAGSLSMTSLKIG